VIKLPQYETELGTELDTAALEAYLGIIVLGLITSSPMTGTGPFNGWRDGLAVTDIYGDTSLDDRFAIECDESVAISLSAQGWCQWVAPLDPTATYTTGVPEYNVEVQSVTGGTTDPLPTIYTVKHGDTFTITAYPDTGYTFTNWEINRANIGIVTSVDNPLNWTVDQNYPIWIRPVFTGGPPPPPDEVTVEVFRLTDLNTPIQTIGLRYCTPSSNYEFDSETYLVRATDVSTGARARAITVNVVEGYVTPVEIDFSPTLPINKVLSIALPFGLLYLIGGRR
jgi:hypothetical protein